MVVKFPVTGAFETNTYFYIDEKSGCGFVIDPAWSGEKIEREIKRNGWHIERILITHAHFDHIGAVAYLHSRLGIPYSVHAEGKAYLENPVLNLSAFTDGKWLPGNLSEADFFNDGAVFSLKANPDMRLRAIHTPGHTADSCMFYDEKAGFAFAGDTVFFHSAGRTDFPGGSEAALERSIRKKVFALPEKTVLRPGHGEDTSVLEEKLRGPFSALN